MNHSPLISVIVPVYCTAQYLPACLDSLLTQTYENLEILLVDDGSTDQSGEICDAYAKQDDRVRVIHQKNSGVSAARNAGLAAAHGEYVSFVDSDDTVEPDTYAYLIENMQKHGADAAMFEYSIDYPDRSLTHTHRGYGSLIGAEQAICATVSPVNRFACTKLFCAYLLERVRFDPDIRVGEDTLFCVQTLRAAQSVYYSERVLYHYRQNNQSVTNAGFSQGYLTVIQAYEEIYALCKTVSRKAEHAALNALAHFYSNTLHGLRHASFDPDRKLYRTYRKRLRTWFGRMMWAWGVSPKAKIKLVLAYLCPGIFRILKR